MVFMGFVFLVFLVFNLLQEDQTTLYMYDRLLLPQNKQHRNQQKYR